MLEWLKAKLANYPHDYVPSAKTYPTLDLGKIASDLKLEKRGRERGKQNLPPADADRLDEVESAVAAKIRDKVRDAEDTYFVNMRGLDGRLGELDLTSRTTEIRNEALGLVANLDTEHRKGVDTLYALRRTVIRAERDLEGFKKRHGLEREAHYPEGRLLYWGLIAILLLVEAILNAGIFGRGHELGLVGGLLLAVMIAFVNVLALGYLGAFAIRCLIYRHWAVRLAGLLLTPAWLGGIGGLGLLGAHLRRHLQAGAPDYASRALETFLAAPFDIGDALSWFFVVATAFFAVLAALDFLKMDDFYFGYGRRDRKLREAEEDYSDEKRALIEEMTRIRDDSVAPMNEALSDLKAHRGLSESLLAHRVTIRQDYEANLAYLEECANTLLAIYRDANRQARSEPAPAHFAERWALDRKETAPPIHGSLEAGEIRKAIEETRAGLEEAIARVQGAYTDYVHKYDTIEELPRETIERGKPPIQRAA